MTTAFSAYAEVAIAAFGDDVGVTHLLGMSRDELARFRDRHRLATDTLARGLAVASLWREPSQQLATVTKGELARLIGPIARDGDTKA
jgi:hypothetical protein